MTLPEGIHVDPTHAPETIEAVAALAASRGLDVGDLTEHDTWVVAAQDVQGEIIGGAAIHMPNHPWEQSDPAPLLFDVVRNDRRGEGIGNLLLTRLVGLADMLAGRMVVTSADNVERNKADFEEHRLQVLGNRVLVLS